MIIGLWGIIVLAPFMRGVVEPVLHDVLGFIPIFGAPPPRASDHDGGFVLALMALPIIASISRDIFLSVPRELKDGALALGATRWEMIRGVVLDSTRPGPRGGRHPRREPGAWRGDRRHPGHRRRNLPSGGRLRQQPLQHRRHAGQQDRRGLPGTNHLFTASLFYLAVILLVMELIVNLAAQLIVYRFERRQGLAH